MLIGGVRYGKSETERLGGFKPVRFEASNGQSGRNQLGELGQSRVSAFLRTVAKRPSVLR